MLKRKDKNKERSLDGARFSVRGEKRAIDWRLCMKQAGSGGGRGEVGGCVLPLCLFRSSTPLPFSLSPLSLFLAHYPLHQQTFSLDGSEKKCPLALTVSQSRSAGLPSRY